MTAAECLRALRAQARPQTAAIYRRHGSGNDVFGVLTSDIAKLAKKIGIDHALAMALWKGGNAEARILALLVADPARIGRREAERLLRTAQVRFLGFYLAALFSRSAAADQIVSAWTKARDEAQCEVGYMLLAARLKDDAGALSDAQASRVLGIIEKRIHAAPNWVRYAMNNAVIAIGCFKPALRQAAIDAAGRIGKVEVDHGETSCRTPDAAAYIRKTAARAALRRK